MKRKSLRLWVKFRPFFQQNRPTKEWATQRGSWFKKSNRKYSYPCRWSNIIKRVRRLWTEDSRTLKQTPTWTTVRVLTLHSQLGEWHRADYRIISLSSRLWVVSTTEAPLQIWSSPPTDPQVWLRLTKRALWTWAWVQIVSHSVPRT